MAGLTAPPRWAFVLGWLMLAGLVVLSLVPLPAAPGNLPGSDKWMHLLTYGWLTLWFLHLYPNRPLVVLPGLIGLGLLIEGLQSFSPHRSMELADALMNATGVLLAWVGFARLGWRMKFGGGRENRHD